MKKLLLFNIPLLPVFSCKQKKEALPLGISSLNEDIKVKFDLSNSGPLYEVIYSGRSLLNKSAMESAFKNMMLIFPTEEFAVIITGNIDDQEFFYNSYAVADLLIADRYTENKGTIDHDLVSDLERYTGKFTNQYLDGVVQVSISGPSLSIKDHQTGENYKVFPKSLGTFILSNSSGSKKFRFDQGKNELYITDYDGTVEQFNRSEAFDPQKSPKEKLRGTYKMTDSDLVLKLEIDENGRIGSDLESEYFNDFEPLTDEIWMNKNINMIGGADSDDNSFRVENAGDNIHRLKVNGDILFTNGSTFDLSSTSGSNVILELGGDSGEHSVTDNADITMDLYKIVMNKGSDTTSTFTIPDSFTITQPAVSGIQPIEILNGKLILNDAGIDITLTDASTGDFYIPNTTDTEASSGSGGLEVSAGTVRVEGDDTGIILDGLLRVSGGSLDMLDAASNGNNFIEYSSSGRAQLELTSGSLSVGSQVRRATASTTGVLQYRQTGGTAIFGRYVAPESSRAVFEVMTIPVW